MAMAAKMMPIDDDTEEETEQFKKTSTIRTSM